MLDFSTLQYNSEHPTFVTILFTVVCSFVLASLIAFTYEKTSRHIVRPNNYIQALVLISIVSAMVMQAIGDSLARGLGMLGALAIIRFRTTIRNPRNMVFMFASIATGIACGVFGFVIAIVGTLAFCLVAFILRLTPFSQVNNLVGVLSVEVKKGEETLDLKPILRQYCNQYLLKTYTIVTTGKREGNVHSDYHIRLKSNISGTDLVNELQNHDKVKSVKLDFKDMEESI